MNLINLIPVVYQPVTHFRKYRWNWAFCSILMYEIYIFLWQVTAPTIGEANLSECKMGLGPHIMPLTSQNNLHHPRAKERTTVISLWASNNNVTNTYFPPCYLVATRTFNNSSRSCRWLSKLVIFFRRLLDKYLCGRYGHQHHRFYPSRSRDKLVWETGGHPKMDGDKCFDSEPEQNKSKGFRYQTHS